MVGTQRRIRTSGLDCARDRRLGRRIFAIIVLFLPIAGIWAPAETRPAARVPKIALLLPNTPAATAHLVEAFRQGLKEAGYVEGKTIVLEIRYAEGEPERLQGLARELTSLKPDVFVASTDPAIAAVRRETQTTPIVMVFSTDPVGTGFVASLAHPGGNVTGVSNIAAGEMSAKRLAILREAAPGLVRVALLWPSITAMFRRAPTYVGKILKGAKPADIPVEQPTKFELVISLKAAKAIGFSMPPSLLQRADQVIQ